MAIVAFNGHLYSPKPNLTGAAVFTNHLLDAATEKFAMIVQVAKTGTIDNVYFRTGTVTTGGSINCRLETVTSAGEPSGTLVAAGASASRTLGSGDDDVVLAFTLTTSPSVTQGDFIAIVIAHSGDSADFNTASLATFDNKSFPYVLTFNTGSWVKSDDAPLCILEYPSADFPVIAGAYPIENLNTLLFDDLTSPDEVGNRFRVPVPLRVAGVWYDPILGAQNEDLTVKFLDDTDTVLTSVAWDINQNAGTSEAGRTILFPASQRVVPGRDYRVIFTPSTDAGSGLRRMIVKTNTHLGALDGGGLTDGWVRTGRTNGGAFSEVDTERFVLGLLIDGIEFGGLGVASVGGKQGGKQ